MITPDQYRDVLRHFASGVTLVTSRDGEKTHGMTVSAFTSVSTDPPLVAVVIDRATTIHPFLERDGATFAVSILGQDQADLSNRFAFTKDDDRFAAGKWSEAVTGSPILEDALAWLDCTVESRFPAGTHTIYLGAVRASRVERPDAAPLVYWNRDYRNLQESS